MKKTYLLPLILFLFSSFHANAQYWQWAETNVPNSNSAQRYGCITADNHGHVYKAGYILSGLGIWGTDTVSPGSYLVKYDTAGNVIWAKGMNVLEPFAISIDQQENILMSGYNCPTGFTFSKFDSSGNFTWQKYGTGSGISGRIKTDAQGNVYFATTFRGVSITIDSSVTIYNNDVTGLYDDIVIVKYSPAGNILWTKKFGGVEEEWLTDMTLDASGNLIFSGMYNSNQFTLGTSTFSNDDYINLFFCKVNPSGDVVWARHPFNTNVMSSGSNSINKLYSDNGDNIYMAGVLSSDNMYFGTVSLNNTGCGSEYAFLAKYDKNGNSLWSRKAGGSSTHCGVQDMTVDASGNPWIVGNFFYSSITFDTITLQAPVDTVMLDPMFIAKYDADGNILFANGYKSGSENSSNAPGSNPMAISADPFGSVYIGVQYSVSGFNFEGFNLPDPPYQYGKNIMVAKYKAPLEPYIPYTPTAINASAKPDINIYPNPASDVINIDLKGETYNNLNVTLRDISGKNLGSYQPANGKIIIPVKNLPTGNYTCLITVGGNSFTEKVTIKR